MTGKKKITFFILGASVVLLFAKIAVAFYYINAGLDIGDEGQATMGYRYASTYFTFPYYQLASNVLGSAVGDFILSRILKLLFELLSVFLLSIALYWWVESVFPEKRGFQNFALIFLAASLSNCSFLFGRIIIYDDFTLFIPALCFFIVSYSWFRKPDSLPIVVGCYCLTGILTGLLIFIKPSASPLLFSGITLLTLSQFGCVKKIKAVALIALVLSTVIGVLCGIHLIGGWLVMKSDWLQITSMSPFWHYNAETMLLNYWHRDTKYLMLVLVSTIVHFALLRPNSSSFRWVCLTAITWLIAIFIFYTDNNSIPVRYQHVMLWLLVSSTSGLGALVLRHFRLLSFDFWLVLLLLLFPFASAFGTANSIFENSSFYYSVSYSLAFIALYFLLPSNFLKHWAYYLLLSLAMWVVTQLAFPFGLPTNLFLQKQALLEADSRMMTDKSSAKFLNDLYGILLQNGFQSAEEVIVTDGITGVATLIGAKMPGMPSLINNAPGFNRYILEKSDTTKKFPYVISFSKQETALELYFKNSKIDLLNRYRLANTLPNVYQNAVALYYGAETSDSVYLYVPVK